MLSTHSSCGHQRVRSAGISGCKSTLILVWMGVGMLSLFACSAGRAESLCYRVRPGETFAYRVQITVEERDRIRTWDGVLSYEIRSVAEDRLTIACRGELAETVKVRRGPGGHPIVVPIPPRIRFPMPRISAHQPEEPLIVIRTNGEIVETRRLENLPYLLGYREALVFEPLGEIDGQWSKERQIDVVTVERLGPIFAPGFIGSGELETSRFRAKEEVRYRVVEKTEGSIVIERTYRLRTDQEVAGRARFEASGSGRLVFDPQLGRFRELNWEQTVAENEELRMVQAQAKISARLLSEDEFQELAKKEKAAAEEAKVRLAELQKPKPLGPGEKEVLIEELKSQEFFRQLRAAERLARAEREEPAEPVCQALLPLLEKRELGLVIAGARALEIWTAPSAEAKLRQLLGSENPLLAGHAMVALSWFPSPELAESIAPRMRQVPRAKEALKRLGPVAEEAVLREFYRQEAGLRTAALEVLAEVGGEKSLEVLRATLGTQPRDKAEIEKTIRAIEARLHQKVESTESGASEGKNSP